MELAVLLMVGGREDAEEAHAREELELSSKREDRKKTKMKEETERNMKRGR